MEIIIKDCNFFLKNNAETSKPFGKKIDMCSAFLIHRNVFLKLMGFLSPIIESGQLEAYSKEKRMQGNFAERYSAIFLYSLKLKRIEFPIIHRQRTNFPTALSFLSFKLRQTTGTAGVPVGSGGLTGLRLPTLTAEMLRLVSA